MKYQFWRGARLDSSENMLQNNLENIKTSTSLQSSLWNAREGIVVQLNKSIVLLCFPSPMLCSSVTVSCYRRGAKWSFIKCSLIRSRTVPPGTTSTFPVHAPRSDAVVLHSQRVGHSHLAKWKMVEKNFRNNIVLVHLWQPHANNLYQVFL